MQSSSLKFVNSVINSKLWVEENKDNKVGARPGVNFSLTPPTALEDPYIGSLCSEVLDMLGVPTPSNDEEKILLAELLAGNRLFPGSVPISHCYCGH